MEEIPGGEPIDDYDEFYDIEHDRFFVSLVVGDEDTRFYWDNSFVRRFPTGMIDHIEVHHEDNTVQAAYAPEEILASLVRHRWRVVEQSWLPEPEVDLAVRRFRSEIDLATDQDLWED